MYDYYRHLYLEYLCEEAPLDHNPNAVRTRTNKPHVWQNFKSVLKHGTEINLDQAWDAALKDGPMVWVWSDQHYGHNNILEFSNRPYPNLELMHECMLLNHNDYVDHGDICIWVGDVAFLNTTETNELIRKHNGYKILILGNHDISKSNVKNLDFDEIHLLKHINFEYGYGKTYDFLFTHYPCKHKDLNERTFNIHGHEHVAHMYTNTHQHINVNCELHGYKPISAVALAEYARKKREFRLPK